MSTNDPLPDPASPGAASASAGGGAAGGAGPAAGAGADVGGAAGGAHEGPAGGGAGEITAEDRAARKREHAVRGTLAAALILEGITVLFVPQTIAAISADGLGGRRLAVLLVLAAALFLVAGIQKRPAGLLLGSALQVAVILTGLMVTVMYFLGLLFAAVWGFLLWVRQEVARAAARAAAEPPV